MENSNKYEKYIKLLEANKNLILTGAPGTGKTYLAKNIADAMEAEYDFVQFHPSYDYTDFVEGLRPTPPDNNGNIGFERKDGIFKEFCIKAIKAKQNSISCDSASKALQLFKEDLKKKGNIEISSFRSDITIKVSLASTGCISVPEKSDWRVSDKKMLNYIENSVCHENDTYTKSIGDHIKNKYLTNLTNNQKNSYIKKYIFIIDEINRGEISKIFGELFFSIDPGYRGEKGIGKIHTFYTTVYVVHCSDDIHIFGNIKALIKRV